MKPDIWTIWAPSGVRRKIPISDPPDYTLAWGQLVTPTRAAAEPGARGPEGLEALGPLEATVLQAERATTGSAPLRTTTSHL